MKVSVLKKPHWNMYAYLVSDVPKEHHQFLEDELYWPVENSFVKQFTKVPEAEMELVSANFLQHGVEALEQMMKIRPTPWEEGLQSFIAKMSGAGVEWYVHGSTAMALWGIEVVPRNVDILIVDPAHMAKVRELFLKETIYPVEVCENWILAGGGGFFMGANVGVAFHNREEKPFDTSPLREIEWKGAKIKLSPLEWLRRDNENYQRPERVKMIEDFIAKRK